MLEKVCKVLQRSHFTLSVKGREACDSLASGAELCLKSCSTCHIPFSGTLGNLFAKLGLKLSGSWRWDLKLLLSIETPITPLEIGPLLHGKLSKRVKYGIKVLAVVCVAGATQLTALYYLAFSKDMALCLAILFCVVLMGSCRKTSHRSQITVL